MMATTRPALEPRRRRGYALLLVVGFEMILLAVWAMAMRSVGSAYRVETSRLVRQTRDNGLMTALGQAVAALEANLPDKDDQGQDITYGAKTAPQTIAVVTPAGSTVYFDVVYTLPVPLDLLPELFLGQKPPDPTKYPSRWQVLVTPH